MFGQQGDVIAAVAQWRTRMNSDAAREIYKDRAATALSKVMIPEALDYPQ